MIHRFFGGVHPKENKQATSGAATVSLREPVGRVVLPMSMHVGPPCKPVVAVGDEVKVGQVIGEPTGLGAPIHASVSGKVVAVEPRPHTGGSPVMAVVIENDALDTPAPPLERPAPPEELTPEQVVELVRQAGLTGMGGAAFPTHVKLSSAIDKVDTLILNGAECEPYITADHRLMVEQPEKVLAGGRVLMRALGLTKFIIGIEANKPDAVAALREREPLRGGEVEVRALRVRYPQGSEKQLIQNITGRKIPPGGLPASVGCAVFNVATAAAVWDAVNEGKPLTHRIVTVTGRGVLEPKNLYVPLGTPIETLIEACGGTRGAPGRVLCGGPMMGVAQYDLTAPIVKGANAILVLNRREYKKVPATEPICIRCGRCVKACPMRLTPLYLHQRTAAGRPEELEDLRILDCIECGACAFACPAHIPLVQSIRSGKAQVRKLQAEAKQAAERKAAMEEKEKPAEIPEEKKEEPVEKPGDEKEKPVETEKPAETPEEKTEKPAEVPEEKKEESAETPEEDEEQEKEVTEP